MAPSWPAISYDQWAETCDTLHAHTQILGKLAVALAPPEPELQHAALRLTAQDRWSSRWTCIATKSSSSTAGE
jgi:hypothetical protein